MRASLAATETLGDSYMPHQRSRAQRFCAVREVLNVTPLTKRSVPKLPLVKWRRRKYLWHMARKAAWEDLAEADLGPYGKKRGTSWGKVLVGLLLIGFVTFVAAYYVPLYQAHQRLSAQYRELNQRSQALSDSVSKAQQELKSATGQRDQLQAERDRADAAQKTDGDRQERLRSALASKLDKFVKKGNAGVVVKEGALFVAFDSAVLFSPQKLDLSPAGRQLLCDAVKVGEAKSVMVSASLAEGSSAPPALAKLYPTPWALSAARAAAVAQALQDTCALPATQLRATGVANREPLPTLKISGDHLELELGR
jgi:chemotaxis protein MotB